MGRTRKQKTNEEEDNESSSSTVTRPRRKKETRNKENLNDGGNDCTYSVTNSAKDSEDSTTNSTMDSEDSATNSSKQIETRTKVNKNNVLPYACKRGCNMTFQHKTQLYRHKKVCTGKSPLKKRDTYKKVGGKFQCLNCEKLFAYQTNAGRHNCKENEIHQCKFCNKMFDWKSKLSRHEKTHKNEILVPSFVSLDTPSSTEEQPSSTEPTTSTEPPPVLVAKTLFGKQPEMPKCSFCEKTFPHISRVKRHEEQVHKNVVATPSSESFFDFEGETSYDVGADEVIGNCTDFLDPNINTDEPLACSSTFVEESDIHDYFTDIITIFQDTIESSMDETGLPPLIEDDDEDEADVLEHVVEGDVCDKDDCEYDDKFLSRSLISYLQEIHKDNNPKFKKIIVDLFGVERIANYKFQYFLACKMDINYTNFKRSMKRWFQAGMNESRGGKNKLDLNTRQKIYDTWISNSQPSTDNRNNRCQVRISENEYNKRYSELENKDVELETSVNKRGRKNVAANRMISTTTVKGIQKKLSDDGLKVSIGSIINNKPFFITYATEKELSLCLCKLCINMTFLFEPLMARAKKDGDETFQSISSFFMDSSSCSKSPNGYYHWKCVNKQCKDCNKLPPATLKCMESEELVTVDQFEMVHREYQKFNTKKKIMEIKKTKCMDRVHKKISYRDLYKKVWSMKKAYMVHKYYVYNDKYHWPKIVATVPELGEITHCDYSENMSQLHKREAQPCHFNKPAYSLHCTVEHIDPEKHPHLKSPYKYIYHLSDCKTHNYAYTSIVANHCVEMNPLPAIIRKKSDNCAVQYKCSWVFGEYLQMANKYNRKVLIYYGPSGHGKGLVDAMSAFGVKGPLLMMVLTREFGYKCANDICEAMKAHFQGDEQKLYFTIPTEQIVMKESTKKQLKIPGCVKYAYHMICFFPSGKILAKVNMCSCEYCLVGDFEFCQIEKGIRINHDGSAVVDDDYETDSDVEFEDDDFGDDLEENMELYEMRCETVLQITQPGNVVALFAPIKQCLQLFYLCRVIKIGKATAEDMKTIFKKHPSIGEGKEYLQLQYYEKKPNSEFSRNGTVIYKPIKKPEYAPPSSVMFPQVNHTTIGKDIHLSIHEYQWLCDSIGQC